MHVIIFMQPSDWFHKCFSKLWFDIKQTFRQTMSDLAACLQSGDSSKIVKQFQLKKNGWHHDASLPADKMVLLNLLDMVEKWQQQSGNGPITIHCSWVVSFLFVNTTTNSYWLLYWYYWHKVIKYGWHNDVHSLEETRSVFLLKEQTLHESWMFE